MINDNDLTAAHCFNSYYHIDAAAIAAEGTSTLLDLSTLPTDAPLRDRLINALPIDIANLIVGGHIAELMPFAPDLIGPDYVALLDRMIDPGYLPILADLILA